MKFARYLQDSQASEWKKAYIDYEGLKVQLGIIQKKAARHVDTWSSFGATDIDQTLYSVENGERYHDPEELPLNRRTTSPTRLWVSETDATMNGAEDSRSRGMFYSMRRRTGHQEISSFNVTLANLPLHVTRTASNAPSPHVALLPRTNCPTTLPLFSDSGSLASLTLQAILSDLPATHAKFFDMLDAELDKVETFYTERAKEMHERAKLLRKQLDELAKHRAVFYKSSARSRAQSWAKRAYGSIPSALSSLIQWFRDVGRDGRRRFTNTFKSNRQTRERRRLHSDHTWRKLGIANSAAESELSTASSSTLNSPARLLREQWNGLPNPSSSTRKDPLNPHEYQCAKKRLRHAVIEHYRGLEILDNYRPLCWIDGGLWVIIVSFTKTLNITGFRKALKKYGKITKSSVMDTYIKEKVEPSSFGSGTMVSTMLKEMEHLFAMRFEHGNRKRAMDRLRAASSSKTHHSSTFRSGMWLGLALPAAAAGSYLSFQNYTRGSLPSWNILLYIYSILVLPVLMALLIGINILVWAQEKISYVFIFGLNLRSRLDHHEYFELPSFLLCTLAYAFWFSLAQLGPSMLWPLIWLALTFVVMVNPVRSFMWGRARWWTIKRIAMLGVSGMWEVEFSDVWLGDQLCSLVYSLSNLYFLGCFYTRFTIDLNNSTTRSSIDSGSSLYTFFPLNATTLYQMELLSSHHSIFQNLLPSAYSPRVQEAWSTCGTGQNWGWYFLLGTLPFIVRCVQNLRRYWDSKLPSQLINAGKYASGMISYFFYYHWRHQMSPRTGKSYVLYCFTTTVSTIYGCAWDLTMDWGMCKPHSRYPFLRQELVYKSYVPCYYLSMVSDLCLRFIWLIYIFTDPASAELYSFVVASVEMLRRVQWNFYRLENKHIHNTGLHRITREVPLPYNLDVQSNEERLRKRMAHLS